jgi:hypothetical protein
LCFGARSAYILGYISLLVHWSFAYCFKKDVFFKLEKTYVFILTTDFLVFLPFGFIINLFLSFDFNLFNFCGDIFVTTSVLFHD